MPATHTVARCELMREASPLFPQVHPAHWVHSAASTWSVLLTLHGAGYIGTLVSFAHHSTEVHTYLVGQRHN